MTACAVETAITFQQDRWTTPKFTKMFAQGVEASGLVDHLLIFDQLGSFFPSSLWRPEITPAADAAKDGDSLSDNFILGALAADATSDLGIFLMCDAIRRGPWLLQTMLTLAGCTDAQVTLSLGAGEVKNVKPFGYKRSEGLARLEDLLRIFRLMMDSDGPVNFDGNIWKLQNASMGKGHINKPQFWTMGGGPKLIDIATREADGFSTMCPGAFATPERWAAQVAQIKEGLERHGRDPEKFNFGVCFQTLMHEDVEFIERSMDHPLVRWIAAATGRLNSADWEAEGVEAPYPKDWHYALKLNPHEMTTEEVDVLVNEKISRKLVEKSYLWGTPKDVAAQIQEYVDAGATWVCPADFLAPIVPPDEAGAVLPRFLEVFSILKGKSPQETASASLSPEADVFGAGASRVF